MTMCHGSFHRDQLLFPNDGAGPPWVIDWQNVSTNIGAIDLARIIVNGLLPAQRQQHERRLLALYHTMLREHGVTGHPEQDLLDDYRFGLMNVILFHSLILADYPVEVIQKYWTARTPFWEVLFHWPGEAAKEWDVLEWMKQAVSSSAAST
jgi:thiamine kinase-like enzyme